MLAITLVMFLLFVLLLVMEDIRTAAGAVVLLGLAADIAPISSLDDPVAYGVAH
jgi:hypothetical protein